MRSFRVAALALATVATALLPAGTAFAAKPLTFHTNIEETFPDEVCDIPVMAHVQGVDTFTIFFDNEGNELRVLGRGQQLVTWTNPENGKVLNLSFAGSFSGSSVENPDGTVTFTETYAGVPENIFVHRGESLTKDVGLATLVTTVDFGDPGDPDDDEVVDFEIAFLAGPHPDLESDFALFCELVVPVLS